MPNLVLPRVHSLLLCDGIKESDDEPDVFALMGVRTVIDALSFPALRPRLCVFSQMTGHAGEVGIYSEITRIETDELIFRSQIKRVFFEDPTIVVPVYFRMRNCIFPAPGVCYIQLFHKEKLISERPLTLREEN